MGRVCHHPVRPCRHPARFGHHPVRAGHRPAGPAGATWVRCGGQACRRYPRRTDPGWLSALATSPPTATQPEDPVEPSCCPIPTMQGRCPCLGSPSAGSAFLCPPNWPGQCWCSAIPAAVKRQRNGRSGDGEGSCEKNVSGLAPAGGRQARHVLLAATLAITTAAVSLSLDCRWDRRAPALARPVRWAQKRRAGARRPQARAATLHRWNGATRRLNRVFWLCRGWR